MNVSEMGKQRQLTTEEKSIAYLEKMRWPEGIACPQCSNKSISRFQAKGKSGKVRHLYQCLDRTCRYQFSPTTGTIFHDSHLPLNKWFTAIALISDSSKPMSVNQLRFALGVQYKTAAHVASRIREAMQNGSIELAEPVAAAKPQGRLRPGAQVRLAPRRSLISPLPQPTGQAAAALQARRAETADFLSQLATPGTPSVSGTAIDNMLSMFVSFAQMTVKPPLFFVNYLKDKVFT